MRKLLKVAYAVIASWFVVVPAFFMASHAEQVLQQAEHDEYAVSWTFILPLYTFAIVGLVADSAFNISYGSVAYQEIPQEWTFTARSTRHLTSEGWRQEKAEGWCGLLHRVDYGHCGGWVPTDGR